MYLREKRASALLFSMLIVGLLMFMGVFLLERILPASRDTKGIELGNAAYYFSESAGENALAYMSGSNPFLEPSGSQGTGFTGTGNTYKVVAMTTVIPRSGWGNSEYNKDWNTLSPGSPIQLRFKNTLNLASPGAFSIAFRIPEKWTTGGYNTFVNTGSGMINWVLSDGSGAILIGSGVSMIFPSDINGTAFSMDSKHGSDISSDLSSAQLGQDKTIASFYTSRLTTPCAVQKCTIRFSIINSLKVKNASGDVTSLPYLEYKITAAAPIPEQYASIQTEGFYRGFKKTSVRRIRQTTGNEALEFAVFQ